MKIAWMTLVIFHMCVVFGNAVAFFILPLLKPWYVALPMCSFIFFVTFSRQQCPLTVLENKLRKKMKKKEIRGFIGHYVWRAIKNKPFRS